MNVLCTIRFEFKRGKTISFNVFVLSLFMVWFWFYSFLMFVLFISKGMWYFRMIWHVKYQNRIWWLRPNGEIWVYNKVLAGFITCYMHPNRMFFCSVDRCHCHQKANQSTTANIKRYLPTIVEWSKKNSPEIPWYQFARLPKSTIFNTIR